MTTKLFRCLMAAVLLATLLASPLGGRIALAEDIYTPPLPAGMVEGVGTHFEVTNSAYLNVTLDSSALVWVNVSSVPSVVEVRLEAADGALSTDVTLSGLVPGLEYHLYADSLENHTIFVASETGTYSWTQDLVDPHVLFFQTVPSTKIIQDNTTGGQCTLIGTWNSTTKTCTLTMDVYETIQINNNGITLDGAGFTLSGPPNLEAGVYVPGGTNSATSGVTIKNLKITGFRDGIYLKNAQGCTITGNTITGVTRYGVNLWPTKAYTGNIVKLNTITGAKTGVYIKANVNQVRGNLINGTGETSAIGIDIDGSSNIVTGSWIYNTNVGIQNKGTNTFLRNTVKSSVSALDGVVGTFYNNNLEGYLYPFFNTGSTQSLWRALPFGGNHWGNYFCEDLNLDGLCDLGYAPTDKDGDISGSDALPWKDPNGWLHLDFGAPVDPILLGTPVSLAVTYTDPDPNVSGYTGTLDWGDGTTTPISGGAVGSIPLSHLYAETGVFELKITLTDSTYLATSEFIYQYVVIYDPSAGFATGGGRFNSPLGAYTLQPELSGHASFGFISKFYRTRTGADILDGETVFEFHVAGLRFESAYYDWLVVNSNKAMFHGAGYLNDDLTRLYKFSLTAVDMGTTGDLFRIQIWDALTDQLIYDNKLGEASNDMEVGTALIEGSIIVQTKSR